MPWFIGILCSIVGAIVVAIDPWDGGLARLVRRTSVRRISDASAGVVAIEGEVKAEDDLTLAVPGTDRRCVYFEMEASLAATESPKRELIALEKQRVPFLVDDGSGRLARIDQEHALYYLEKPRATVRGRLATLPDDLRGMLVRAAASRNIEIDPQRDVDVRTGALEVGERVYVLGRGALEPCATQGAYRDARGEILVVRSGAARGRAVVSTKARTELAAQLSDAHVLVTSVVLLCGAAISFVVGFLSR